MADNIRFFRPNRDFDTGKVIAGAQDSSKGLLFEDGRNLLRGTEEGNMFGGSDHDDVMVTKGAKHQHSPLESGKGRETVFGGEGYDTIVLPGNREDYYASIPDAVGYPSARAPQYEENDMLYGQRLNLEDQYGNTFSLDSIERIVFAGDIDALGNPREIMQDIETKISNGTLPSLETRDLFNQIEAEMDPAEIEAARLASTRDAVAYLDQQNIVFADKDDWPELMEGAIDAARKAHPNIMDYEMVEIADAPTSETTADSIGYDAEVQPVPLPDPSTLR